ncbi:MAG: transketolase [Actinomycetota bacterium]|nr:transketolase [Actinomycetota bacterium]
MPDDTAVAATTGPTASSTAGPAASGPGAPAPARDIEERGVAVIRGLAMDAPERAKSGHPGTAMALAPLAHVLFTRVMHHDPSDPGWPDRDRFVLSCGHASILLYSMLYLTGYGLTIDDLRSFRQWGSRTPGHPEVGLTPGVEVTTGPLGQGIANSVGLAMAERWLRARFGTDLVDHHTFAICSDGDLMEGISHEAASLAGHLGLGRLVCIYDDNHITIDGATELAVGDDAPGRFEAYGWHVEKLGEAANDLDALESAIRRAMAVEDRPSMLVLRSHIGWPSPHKTDTPAAHGDPLGDEEVRETKVILGLPPDETFFVPDDVLAMYRTCAERGQAESAAWRKRLDDAPAERRSSFGACLDARGLPDWELSLPVFEAGKSLPTRRAINECLRASAAGIPGLVAGSADLTGNTGVSLGDAEDQDNRHPGGSQVHYGIREHAMASAMNGMALHGGILPVGGTFFIFSDYMRPAVRLAALSGAHVVYFFTHDSVGLGEDGPTHQPIEHLASLRAMPGLRVIRPADANECAQAWRIAVDSDGPSALVLTRQAIPVLPGTAEAQGVARGGYVLSEVPGGSPDLVLVGTGSEVQLCLAASAALAEGGVRARVVSLPCWELFDAEPEPYRRSVIPSGLPVLAVEAGSSFGWERYADESVSIDRFGASAPGSVVLEHLGFTPENVVTRAKGLLERHHSGALGRSALGRSALGSDSQGGEQ